MEGMMSSETNNKNQSIGQLLRELLLEVLKGFGMGIVGAIFSTIFSIIKCEWLGGQVSKKTLEKDLLTDTRASSNLGTGFSKPFQANHRK
jgi:hypothetical protein